MTRLIIVIGLFLLVPYLPVGRASVYAAVLINEICPKECGAEKTQWIELYNNGNNLVSLAEWKLENVGGDKKTYTIPPETTIVANGFATFSQAQTAINLYSEGDTVKLFDAGNAVVDSQGYPSILGYNTSMGRSVDGAGVWTICTGWTKHLTNNCPAPTNTPTPLPTKMPTSTPSPTLTPSSTVRPTVSIPTPISVFTIANQPAQSQVLGLTDKSSATAHPKESAVRWYLGVASLCIAALALLTLVVRWYRRYKA